MWLLALYQVVAAGAGRRRPAALAGTTQNDIIKEYLSRGTYVFPPGPSLRLTTDLVAYTVTAMPQWNPINICSYHLQEAGRDTRAGGRVRDVHGDRRARRRARQRAGARRAVRRRRPADLVLRQRRRAVRRGDVQDARLRRAVGRADPRALRRDGPEAAPVPVRRAGELARADRGAAGEQRPADRAGDARASRCPRTPGPAPSSCRPGTRRSACRGRGTSSGRCGSSRCSPSSPTCWSTRTCSTAARSSSRRRCAEIVDGARAEIDRVQAMGGAVAAVESGYMKSALVASHARAGSGSRPARTSSSGSTGSRRPSRTR